MCQKLTKAIIPIVVFFLTGVDLIYIGFFKGNEIAIGISRPKGESIWTTSQELIRGCTYFPIIIGVFLLMLSLIFSAVLFSHWMKNPINQSIPGNLNFLKISMG